MTDNDIRSKKTCFMVYIEMGDLGGSNDMREIVFFEKEGNYTHLHGLNVGHHLYGEELLTLLHGGEANRAGKIDWAWDVTILDEPTKDWDYFVEIDYRL